MQDIDSKFMKEAIRAAKKGLGRTSPNPAVGAVIVRKGRIIAKGYHKRAGGNHAEIEALEEISGRTEPGDVLYVTLEPCNHIGKTPPCTHAIAASSIRRVVVGMKDPNPMVSGKGLAFLSAKGIDVTVGILETECRGLNEDFIKFITTGRPFIVAKSAMTLDGWTAASSGHSKWITGEKSRALVHRLRDRFDGIMVGVGTIIADDPLLTTRLKGHKARDPIRVIVDTHMKIPPEAKVLNHGSKSVTLLAVGEQNGAQSSGFLKKPGVEVLSCPVKDGRIDLNTLMDELGRRSIMSLMVEGGATILGAMIREQLIDRFYIFKAPKILGGGDGVPMASGTGPELMDGCVTLRDVRVRRMGEDTLFVGTPVYDAKITHERQ